MKRPNEPMHYLTPQAEGWAVWRGEQRLHIAATLAEAVAHLPAAARFELALPCHPLILERLRLPVAGREELAGMVQLQWEKSLPFPPEEITGGFMVIDPEAVVVWSAAASTDGLTEFEATFKKANRWPEHAAPYVCQVAAACPHDETVLAIYREEGHWVVAVVENQRPGWVHVMSATDAAGFAAEYPSLMLTAGLDGVPTYFNRVLLSLEAKENEAIVKQNSTALVETLPLVKPGSQLEIDLLPADWKAADARERQGKVWRQRAVALAAVYVVIALAAAIDLLLLQHRASSLEAELKAQQPTLALLQSHQEHYNSLAAAIDSRHYTIEVLYLLNRCLPEDTVRFTEFEQMPDQWRVVGEAPSAGLAIDYLARLKHDPELSSNDISADPPRLLANQRAQFQVIGKP